MADPTPTFQSLRPTAASIRPASPPSHPSSSFYRSLATLGAVAALAAGVVGAANPSKSLDRSPAAPEIKRAETGNPTRWHASEVDVTLDRSLQDLGPGAMDAVRSGFGAWIESDASLPSVRFNLDNSTKNKAKLDGVNRIIAAPITLPGHENDLALTISYLDESGDLIEADMIFNTNHAFHDGSSAICSKQYDLQSVAAHEAGHFMGLGEDMEETDATMFFKTARCETKKRSLATMDLDAVQFLYDFASNDADELEQPGVGCSVASRLPAGSKWAPLLVAGLAALLASRRRAI